MITEEERTSPIAGMVLVFAVLVAVISTLFYLYGREVEREVQEHIIREELGKSRAQAREFAKKVAEALQRSKFANVVAGHRSEIIDFRKLAAKLLSQNRYVAYVHIQNEKGETLMYKGPKVIQKVVFRNDGVTFMESTTETMRYIALDDGKLAEGGIHDISTILKSDDGDGRPLGRLRIGLSQSKLNQYSMLATHLERARLSHYLLAATFIMITAFIVLGYHFWQVGRLKETIAYQTRMAYVGSLASGLVHELRNPINSINLNLSLLEEEVAEMDGPETAGLKRLVGRMKPGIEQLEKISSEFLDFARPPEVRLVPVRMNEIVREVVELAAAQCDEAGIERRLELDGVIGTVRADATRLRQIVLNLVVNAVQAMPDGGVLTVATARDDDERIRIVISDTGVGIPEELKGNLFKLFFTTKEGGVGLGLPIVKRLVEDLDGTIDVETGKDEGTTFTVRLPFKECDERQDLRTGRS